jgi:menaquinone-dependent protoporphyrinogen oxidase
MRGREEDTLDLEERGMNRVLVAYASRYGSTAEVAREIGGVLTQAGLAADVLAVEQVRDLGPYGAIVLGTAIRMEKPLKPTMTFVAKHHEELARIPAALFSLGVHMRHDTPENRDRTRRYLAPLLASLPRPIHLGFFGGKVDYARIGPFWRFIASHDKSGEMAEGDWRDWEAIRRWAGELVPLLAAGRA